MCVRDQPIGLTRNPVTDIGSPLTDVDPAYRAPAAVYGEYGPSYAARPVYVDRAPAYPERYYARQRYSAQEYDYEYAPRPPLPVPYRRAGAMRRRLWQVGLLRLKPPALRGCAAADGGSA